MKVPSAVLPTRSLTPSEYGPEQRVTPVPFHRGGGYNRSPKWLLFLETQTWQLVTCWRVLVYRLRTSFICQQANHIKTCETNKTVKAMVNITQVNRSATVE